MSLFRFLLGRRLASHEDKDEKIGPGKGIGIFGIDALGSAVYGPEASLTILIPLGLAGVRYLLPVTLLISFSIILVYISYNQCMKHYPDGGGTYSVVSENLGTFMGLVAGASLMVDYILVVAVGISAGVGTLISVFPGLRNYTLLICLAILLILTIINLRGVSDTGSAFIIPAYLFMISMLIVLIAGIVKSGNVGENSDIIMTNQNSGINYLLLFQTWAYGSIAMTGVEGVSNGIPVFREPLVKNSRITLAVIIGTLIIMLILTAILCNSLGIGATQPGSTGYKSVLFMLVMAVTGGGWLSYIPVISILLIVVFQANTSFSGFPGLCNLISQNGFLPQSMGNKGRRLVYTYGINILSILAAFLLIGFGGVTDRLLPLFAISALTTFTLSQAGMIVHWKRHDNKNRILNIIINAAGMILTGTAAITVLIMKFTEGAWLVLIVFPLILIFMQNVSKHYRAVQKQLNNNEPVSCDETESPVVILPAEEWDNNTAKALQFAISFSKEIIVLHVSIDDKKSNLISHWNEYVEKPLIDKNMPVPQLKIFHSRYRLIITPVIDYVIDFERENPSRKILLLIPKLVERKWYHRFLHNQRGLLIAGMLLYKGSERTAIVYVPWHLTSDNQDT
jgi:amino acid transporter